MYKDSIFLNVVQTIMKTIYIYIKYIYCIYYILSILSISGAMQEIPDTSDKFGLDCIVDGSIPAGNLDNNELCMVHIFIL